MLNRSQTDNQELFKLQNHCIFLKNYAMVLRKRLVLVRNGFALKNDYEKNEVDVIYYETLVKINITETKLQQYLIEYTHKLNAHLSDLEELNQNFDTLLQLAKKEQADNIEIKHILYHANWKLISDNVTEKIAFYKDLKLALSNSAKKD
jgi:hypothetical protein